MEIASDSNGSIAKLDELLLPAVCLRNDKIAWQPHRFLTIDSTDYDYLSKLYLPLYLPPIKLDGMENDPTAPAVGVPVAPFPRWMRCSLCDTRATVESGVFKLVQDMYRPDKTEYVHQGCLKSKLGPPSALSVRFLLACREGHMTDFNWLEFVQSGRRQGHPCRPPTTPDVRITYPAFPDY